MNWVRFFDQHHIEHFKGSGENIEIHCAWCGASDQGHHLSVSLNDKGYRCWRNRTHRGRNPVRLIQILLNCSLMEAERIAGVKASDITDDSNFGERMKAMLNKSAEVTPIFKKMTLPSDFKLIENKGSGRLLFSYLENRGYSKYEVEELVKVYNLRYTINGVFAYRVIIPIFMARGVVNWTARAIGNNPLRYRTLTTDINKSKETYSPPAIMSIEQTLLNYADISEDAGQNLIVVEGPFDAMKVDFHGQLWGTRATCIFGKNISSYQIGLIEKIRDQYDNLYLMLDNDSELDRLNILGQLSHLDCRSLKLPSHFKDPAEMDREAVMTLIENTQ